jgi:hypothetical protein
MSALEKQIWELVQGLDTEEKLKLVERIEQNLEAAFDFDAWLHEARQLRQELRDEYGADYTFSVQDMLDEIREEASWRGLS